jgi:cytochrome P450
LLRSHLRDVHIDRLGLLERLRVARGPNFSFRAGPRVFCVLSTPEAARLVLLDNADNYAKGIGQDFARSFLGEGLLTAEGEEWRTARRTIQPLYRTDRVRDLMAPLVAEARKLALHWQEQQTEIDILGDVMTLTLKVSWRQMFGAGHAPDDSVRDALEVAFNDVGRRIVSPFVLPLAVPVPSNRRVVRAVGRLGEVVDRAVRTPHGADGLLGSLVTAYGRTQSLCDQVTTLLFSGHETTAVGITWCLYRAASVHGAWDSLAAEHEPGPGSLTDRLVRETLRLHPPVWAIPRTAIAADKVGNLRIPQRSTVLVSPYLMHRDPRKWTAPDTFDAERFQKGEAGDHSWRGWYMPFGAGPRNCVGQALALAEIRSALNVIAGNCRIQVTSPPRAQPLLTLRPQGLAGITPRG